MKRSIVLTAILTLFALCSCAQRHNVGDTRAARKAAQASGEKVGSQFNGVR